MSEIISTVVNGKEIFVEVERRYGSENTTSLDDALSKTGNAFELAKDTITGVTESVIGAIQAMDRAITPEEFTVEFAIKFSAEGQAILAKASAEANLKITLSYKHKNTEV